MSRRKDHRNRVYQLVGEPAPNSIIVGYVRYSSDMQDASTISTQKRVITEFALKKGWVIALWYEEPARSAKYEDVEQRPVFAELLRDADAKRFQGILCYTNNRWARNVTLSTSSLSRLRRAKVWWATADGQFDIDRIQEDAGGMIHVLDSQISESYVRQLSKRTIDGKEDRAREGYHNGWVPFGYLAPEYPAPPSGAPSTWKPPRVPVSPDSTTFPALVKIGELAAQGWSDRAIADELEGYMSRTSRFGERLLTKDTVAAIRRSWFPREFAPGCGHGTIDTPSGELVEGKHQAAWSYELWQRMIEVKAGQYRRPTKDAQKRPHEFSRIIVCAACRRLLRVTFGNNKKNILSYYRDTSLERKLPCSASGNLSVRGSLVVTQFGEILRSVELPVSWRGIIVERCKATDVGENHEDGRIQRRRDELEAEQKRLTMLFVKGYITEGDLDGQMEKLRAELFVLPIPIVQNTEVIVREAISIGETLERMADYWNEAMEEERRDIVWSLLNLEGLVYDLERRVIVGLKPRVGVLPILALGLEATGMWEQRDSELWLREDYLPVGVVEGGPYRQPPSMTPAQQEQAIMLIRQGMSLRKVADLLGTSYQSVHRLVKREGLVLQPSVAKLTVEQLQDARLLQLSGMSLRQIAVQLGVSKETLRRALKRSEV